MLNYVFQFCVSDFSLFAIVVVFTEDVPQTALLFQLIYERFYLARLPFWFPCFVRLRCFSFPCCSVDLYFKICFNIPNIPKNKRNVERMLKQSLKAFKLFQQLSNLVSTRFNTMKRGWQTLSTLPFNKIERMLKQMLKPFARALMHTDAVIEVLHLTNKNTHIWRSKRGPKLETQAKSS